MSIKNTLSPLRPVKQARTLAMLTTSVAVSGGLVAGLGISQNAGAAPETGAIHDAAAAATTPLELKSVTPAKKLVVAPKAASKPAAAKAAAVKAAPKTAVVKAAPAKPATPRVVKQAPAVKAAQHVATTVVSRSQARSALTAPAAKPARTKHVARATQAPVTHRAATAPKHTPKTHHVRRHHAVVKQAAPQTITQRTTVDRVQARHAVTRHVQAAPQTQQRQQERPAQVSRTQVRQAVTARSATPTYASHAQSTPTKTVATPAKASSSGVISIAAGLTGIPYVYGGSSMSGIDCSGFVAMVYAKMGIQLPHQSEEIKAMTTPVSNPQPGDLAFLPGHVAIYAGNGMVYEARHPGTVTGLYPAMPNMTYGRL